MSDIGKYLRNWFEKNQISIYQAAKESNINRTTLQKVLSGDRTPSRHLVTSLVSALPFSMGEVREIWDLFESDQSGMGTYMQNQYIDRMMKNISFISADNVAVPVQSEKNDGKEQLLLYRTPYEVEELLKELLKEEMEKKNSFPFGRSVLIHAPAENEMFHSIFNVIYMSPEAKLLKISHLTRLYKNQSGQTQSVENLKALANILPFFSTHRLNYQVGYYYSSGATVFYEVEPFAIFTFNGGKATDLGLVSAEEPGSYSVYANNVFSVFSTTDYKMEYYQLDADGYTAKQIQLSQEEAQNLALDTTMFEAINWIVLAADIPAEDQDDETSKKADVVELLGNWENMDASSTAEELLLSFSTEQKVEYIAAREHYYGTYSIDEDGKITMNFTEGDIYNNAEARWQEYMSNITAEATVFRDSMMCVFHEDGYTFERKLFKIE